MLHRIANKVERTFGATPLHRLTNPRKTHLYCIGSAKSGTHSIAAMFEGKLRSAHEPESDRVIDLILENEAGRVGDAELSRFLLKRDRRLWLDVDSSQLNFFFIKKLVELFPEAKFVLTIRDPYSWLDSFIDHQLARGGSDTWVRLRNYRFRPDIYKHQVGELILKANGLYTLDGYLSYWAHHNRTVIESVPQDRLLIVRTDKITESAEKIAAFAGVPASYLRREESHAFKAKRKFGLIGHIDQSYLEQKVKMHCGDLIARFFPEIQSRVDTLSAFWNA